MSYYIIRDSNNSGDVTTVWNWGIRDWAFQIDGEYHHPSDRFAYKDKAQAYKRAHAILEKNKRDAWNHARGYKPAVNVRVVTALELKIARELER